LQPLPQQPPRMDGFTPNLAKLDTPYRLNQLRQFLGNQVRCKLIPYLFIIKIVHRVQVKRKQIQTQKRHKNTDTHIKKESEINPKDESHNHPVHRAVIKHEISSILNISAQSSGLSLNNKNAFKTETFANSSADTLDR